MVYKVVISLVLLQQISSISTSDGDRSPFYQKCVKSCMTDYCEKDGWSFKSSALGELDIWSRLLWNCRDDCRYNCMWRTVNGFIERGYTTPKFHGKWPFVRVFGVQEPGSAFASLLNLAAHVYMYTEIRRQFPLRLDSPFVLFWHIFAAVCMNAWTWSTIFHTRDNAFTEFMDYACALSMVMSLCVAAIYRVFHKNKKTTRVILSMMLLYYFDHLWYLYKGPVDYGLNMMINIFFGVVGSLVWLVWSWRAWRKGARHTWRAGAFTLLSGAALALELFDFPPKYDMWDAHAIWHLATVPLPLLFYKFVIDDLHYLEAEKDAEKTKLI